MVLGHELTGEVLELGPDCEFLEVGDICSVPFNIACGRCAACKRGDTGVCLNVNPARPGELWCGRREREREEGGSGVECERGGCVCA
jgi:glutathione-independent formaldehyde dehydrogenase